MSHRGTVSEIESNGEWLDDSGRLSLRQFSCVRTSGCGIKIPFKRLQQTDIPLGAQPSVIESRRRKALGLSIMLSSAKFVAIEGEDRCHRQHSGDGVGGIEVQSKLRNIVKLHPNATIITSHRRDSNWAELHPIAHRICGGVVELEAGRSGSTRDWISLVAVRLHTWTGAAAGYFTPPRCSQPDSIPLSFPGTNGQSINEHLKEWRKETSDGDAQHILWTQRQSLTLNTPIATSLVVWRCGKTLTFSQSLSLAVSRRTFISSWQVDPINQPVADCHYQSPKDQLSRVKR